MMNGTELKEARGRLRLKQTELAAIVGLSSERLSRMETGAVPVTIAVDTIVSLLERDATAVDFALRRTQDAKV